MNEKTVNYPLTGLAHRFIQQLPQCRALGMRTLGASAHHVLVEMPYDKKLIGYPESGVVHGGVITTLMDTLCGTAVVCKIFDQTEEIELCPTLDLRIDYMKPAEPELPLLGFAECFKLTSAVAFTRGIAYQESREDPVAQVNGAFMRIGAGLMTKEFLQAVKG